eukprot:gene10896-12055_t
MCSRQKKTPKKNTPPYVFSLYNFEPSTANAVYDSEPAYAAPPLNMQLAFKEGDKLRVLSEVLDWWILCKHVSGDGEEGYAPSCLLAPICVETANDDYHFNEIEVEGAGSKLIPCLEEKYIDMKYFPNAVEISGKVNRKPSPVDTANFFSRLTFWWMTGLIFKGFKRPLVDSDLWALSHANQANYITNRFQKHWKRRFHNRHDEACNDNSASHSDSGIVENQPVGVETITAEMEGANIVMQNPTAEQNSADDDKESKVFVKVKDSTKKKKEHTPSLWLTLFHCVGLTFLSGSLLKFFHDCFLFVNPYILRLIIQYVEGKGPQETWRGYVYAVCLLLVGTAQSFFLQHYFDKAVLSGIRSRSAVMGIVYRKMLLLSNKGKKTFTSGEMVNLMSVDATKFQDITTYLNMVWSAPFQIIVSMVFLYNLLGASMFAGVAVMCLLLPFNYFVSKKVKAAQTKMMGEKDQRIKGMNDIFSGIKVLKLYAWEESFLKKITNLRSKELKKLRSFMLWKALTTFAFGCTPFIVSLATFAVYVLIGNELNAEKAFVAISLFNIVQFPMTILPDLVTRIIQVQVSTRRLTKFLLADELDGDNVLSISDKEDPVTLSVKHGSFTWDDKNSFMLKHINLEVKQGSLVAIVGQVGCGKSSLLSALLGEMEKLHGVVKVNGSVAYAPQQAWIQNATLENNILCGRSYHSEKYNRIIDACALRSDLEILPAGDLTEIGEKGINLSGGQKQRVSLARALYSRADVYFFDDPLSAVDSHVGKHIFDNVIGPNSLLTNKVRILVTHNLNVLPQVDKIVVMKDGSISEVGTYDELMSREGAYAELLRAYVNDDDDENGISDNEDDDAKRARTSSLVSIVSNKYSSLEKLLHSRDQIEKRKLENEDKAKMIKDESSETGRVKLSIFLSYMKSMGICISLLIILFGIATKFFLVGARIWLAGWSSQKSVSSSERDRYLMIYGVLGLCHCISTYLSSIFLIIGAFIASSSLHDNLLTNVLHLPMTFFEVTPVGRLANRFSKDVNVVDDDVPATLSSFYGCLFSVVSVIFTISYSTPLFLVALLPLGIMYAVTQRFYVASSRQLKRIESVRRSPIYNHFFESINGVTVIRAHKQQQKFTDENDSRIDSNQAAYAPSMYANRWLAMRLELVGNCMIFFAALFAIISKDKITPGLAGLSISYAMQVTQTLNWMIRMTSKLETDIIAVERIMEYTKVAREADWINPDHRPSETWPEKGAIEIDDYSVRYREGLDFALHQLSFNIKAAEKVGVVGRTGAGKSTIAMVLFRMIEASEGKIKIDGLDIADIGLQDLRSRLTIIPQDPVLFTGTIRFNLDPFNQHSDESIWNALEISHLKPFVSGLNNKLEEDVSEGGENFSVGQRQLICLARALLRRTNILILDEATAAIDMETDEFLQKTIRDEFSCCTILTIAHRLNTVMDYDRILLLDKGKIIEFDSPQNLLQAKGAFYDMAKDANLV